MLGNLSMEDIGWQEMGDIYGRIGKDTAGKVQSMVSEYYKLQPSFEEQYVKDKMIDEIKDIGSYAASKGYDMIKVTDHGIYNTTEVVVLNRTKCIFLGE